MTELLYPDALSRLGWVLVHALWQGLALACLLAGALHLARKSSSAFRHNLALAALLLWLVAPVITNLALGTGAAGESTASSMTRVPVADILGEPSDGAAVLGGANALGSWSARAFTVERLARLAAPVAPRLGDLLPLVGLVWLLSTAFLSARFLASLVLTDRLRRSGRALPALQGRLDALRVSMNIVRAVTVRQSARVDVPTVVGTLRPLILLPRASLVGMSDEQLELVLAHELAHVKRRDGRANLLLAAAEVLLPFHPFTHWTASVVRLEREQACDDLALKVTGYEPLALAQALARLEGTRHTPRAALGITGGSGQLVRRIRRVLGVPTRRGSPRAALQFLAVGLLTLWLASGVAQEGGQPGLHAPIVVIDVGHGDGTGASGYADEEEVVLAVALKVAQELELDGIVVTLTRSDAHLLGDTPEEDLARRLEAAEGSELLLSLHAGSARSATTHGVQTWVPALSGSTLPARHQASLDAAEVLHSWLLGATGAQDLGIMSNRFAILDRASAPAVMVELGFVSNPAEAERLADDEYQDVLAQALAAGIREYVKVEVVLPHAAPSPTA